jgi:ribosome maturation factor RimP
MANVNTHPKTENPASPALRSPSASERLLELLTPMVEQLGYDLVHLEIQTHRQPVLRLFIDRLEDAADGQPGGVTVRPKGGVTIEDCAIVSRALDEPLDALPEIEKLFHGAYELEVSSPGVDRPLRRPRDYERYFGREARIHVYRPLTAEELGNADYQAKNPKQKNYLGRIQELDEAEGPHPKVLLTLIQEGSVKAAKATAKTKKAASRTNSGEIRVWIPLALISKANLEPTFEFGDSDRTGEEVEL